MDTELPNPNVHWHDVLTGVTIERAMTDTEYEAFLLEIATSQERQSNALGDNPDVQHEA